MRNLSRKAFSAGLAASIVAASGFPAATTGNASSDFTRTAEGLTIYLGIVPAEIVRGHLRSHPERTMHGGPPSGPHQYHLIISIFDTATGARVSEATVMAKISGLGLSGSERTLEPMQIADTTTYGAFIYFPGTDLYTIAVTIRRPAPAKPATVVFKYDHRL